MNLFILRHGEAETFAETDAQRPLTDRGRREVAAVVTEMQSELTSIQEIYVSPYLRAQQTAAIVLDIIGERPMITTPLITPDVSTKPVFDLLEASTAQHVLLVSHQPLVGRLVNGLAGKPSGFYGMATAALAHIKLDPIAMGCGEVLWLK